MLGLVQADKLRAEDFAVYALLEERAGASHLTYVTGAEVGRLLGMSSQAAVKSFRRLAAAGLVLERARRGSRWGFIICNPAVEQRVGPADCSTVVFSAAEAKRVSIKSSDAIEAARRRYRRQGLCPAEANFLAEQPPF